MAAFFKRMMRIGLAFGTRRLLREALASAIVTLVVTAAFSGFATRSQAPVEMAAEAWNGPSPRPVSATGPSAEDVAKVWFDPTLVPPGAHGFRLPANAAAKPAHRRVASARPVLVSARSLVPAPRPVERAAMAHAQGNFHAIPQAHPQASGAKVRLAVETPPAEGHGFRIFGVAPTDLLPTPSGIVRGARSIVSIADWF